MKRRIEIEDRDADSFLIREPERRNPNKHYILETDDRTVYISEKDWARLVLFVLEDAHNKD